MTIYTGTPSDDTFTGSATTDTVSIASIAPMTTFSLGADGRWIVKSTAGTDTLSGIEKVALLDGTLTLGSGGPQRVNSTSLGLPQSPDVAVLSNGDRVVTWSAVTYSQATGYKYETYAQRFNPKGEAFGPEFVVDAATAPEMSQPVVTALSTGGFVAAWKSSVGTAGVYAQRYDNSGMAVGAQFVVQSDSNATNDTFRDISIAEVGNGGFAISFSRKSIYFETNGEFVARYSATGTSLGVDIAKPYFNFYGNTNKTKLVQLADHGYLVVQTEGHYYSSGYRFTTASFARHDSNGTKIGETTRILPSLTPENFSALDVAGLSGGGFVAAWSHTDGSMYTQRFDAAGVALTQPVLEFQGVGGNSLTSYLSGVEGLSTGGYIVWWGEFDYRVSGYQVHAQRYDATGIAVGTELTLERFSGRPNSLEFDIAAAANGGFVVTWTGEDKAIHVANYDALGLPVLNTLTGDASADTLTVTGDRAVRIVGAAGDDILSGGNGDDILDGGAGRDTLAGGAGDDVYFADATDTIDEAADGGNDAVYIAGSYSLDRYIERAVLIGTIDANLTGNNGNNLLSGNSGHNVLNGAQGADTMEGGAGDDTYIVDNGGDTVRELADEGNDTVVATVSVTLAAHVEAARLTGTRAINATGNDLDNQLTGNAGANILDGGKGSDTLAGGAGDDTYVVDGSDLIVEAANAGTDTVLAGASATLDANLENLTLTGDGKFSATGNELDNVIVGNDGDNVIDGQGGADTMDGGRGNDILLVDDAGDVTRDADNRATAKASVSHTIGEGVSALYLMGTSAIDGTGNAGANAIFGNSAANVLKGAWGNDTLYGGAGNDVLYAGDGVTADPYVQYGLANLSVMYGGTGNDAYHVEGNGNVIVELAGGGTDTVHAKVADSYLLAAQLENLVLEGADVDGIGNGLANGIVGTDGANLLDGAAGADAMTGMGGDDTYRVDQAGDRVIELAGGGTDEVLGSVSWTLGANVENLTLTGALALNGTGNELGNRITGNRGSNQLSGALGDDMLTGGGGNDTLDGGDGNDVLLGNTGNDTLRGGAGDDRLHAGGGTDLLDGGAGIDTADYTLLAGGVTIDLTVTTAQNGGTQTLTGIENVSGSARGDDDLRGDALANVLSGNGGADRLAGAGGSDTLSGGEGDDRLDGGTGDDRLSGSGGDDLLEGGAGNDRLDGGSGADTADYYLGTAVTLDLNLRTAQNTGGAGIDTLLGIEHLLGSKTGNDRLSGNLEDNMLFGYGGNDILAGGAGTNLLDGGDGDDVFLAQLGDDTIEGGRGTDLVDYSAAIGSVSVMLSVSSRDNGVAAPAFGYDREPGYSPGTSSVAGLATGAATGKDTLFDIENVKGTAFNDTIAGSAAVNTLDGMGGSDKLIGGDGSDTYYVDNAGDLVIESNASRATGGTDLVIATVSTTLGANVEHLRLSGTAAINGTGNTLDNTIHAGAGANAIDGVSGIDTLSYQDASAAAGTTAGVTLNLSVLNAAKQATASGISGKDLVRNIDNLTGSRYNDTFTGTSAANVLDGGAGNDTLAGGLGKDVFVFSTALSAAGNLDRITDFSVADDTIHLENAVFARLTAAGALNAAFLRIGSAAADANDYLVYDKATGTLSYDADGSGGGGAVQFAKLTAGLSLTSADFFVI